MSMRTVVGACGAIVGLGAAAAWMATRDKGVPAADGPLRGRTSELTVDALVGHRPVEVGTLLVDEFDTDNDQADDRALSWGGSGPDEGPEFGAHQLLSSGDRKLSLAEAADLRHGNGDRLATAIEIAVALQHESKLRHGPSDYRPIGAGPMDARAAQALLDTLKRQAHPTGVGIS